MDVVSGQKRRAVKGKQEFGEGESLKGKKRMKAFFHFFNPSCLKAKFRLAKGGHAKSEGKRENNRGQPRKKGSEIGSRERG